MNRSMCHLGYGWTPVDQSNRLYKYTVKAVCIELSINMQDTPTTDSRIRSRMRVHEKPRSVL